MHMTEEQLEVVVCTREEVSEDVAQQIVALVNAAFLPHRNIFPNERTTLAKLDEMLIENDIVLLRTQSTQKLLGAGLIRQEEQSLHLGMLAVDPHQQGRGLGTQLVHAVEGIARQRGLKGVVLTAVRNIGNVDYYLHLGFHINKEEHLPMGTWDAIRAFDMAYMEKCVGDGSIEQPDAF
jgi:ribosomal protein S18 acetylase RimI-like enzyme